MIREYLAQRGRLDGKPQTQRAEKDGNGLLQQCAESARGTKNCGKLSFKRYRTPSVSTPAHYKAIEVFRRGRTNREGVLTERTH